MKRRILNAVVLVGLSAAMAGCGGTSLGGSVTGSTGTTVEVVPAGPQVWLLEWNGEMRQTMSVRLKQGILLLGYDEVEGRLSLLPAQCRVDGRYQEGVSDTRPRQTEAIASEADVHAKLGIKIASVEAGFEQGKTWRLDYVTADVRTAASGVTAAQIPAGCEGATHYVSVAYFGAYHLDTGTAVDGGVFAGVEMGPVEGEIGGGGAKGKKLTLQDGDVDKCHEVQNTPANDPACLGILKIELAKIE